MSFRTKIWAAMAVAGIGPLLLLGLLSFRASHTELGRAISQFQLQSANELARYCKRFVDNAVADLKLMVGYTLIYQMSREELVSVLNIPYTQFSYLNIVALLDEHGKAVVAPVYLSGAAANSAGHESIDGNDLDEFSRRVPLAAALTSGIAVGPPYRLAKRKSRVVVAVRIDSHPVKVVAAEVSLGEIHSRLEELARTGAAAFLVDSSGSVLAHGTGKELMLGDDEKALVLGALSGATPRVREIARGKEPWLAAFSPVRQLGWGIVVAQPSSDAYRGVNKVRDLTLAWAGLAIALTIGLGALLAQGLSRPIKAFSAVTRAVSKGIYEPVAAIRGHDELTEFGAAFNQMIAEIRRRDSEIRDWNQELQNRVDKRTSELKQAQDQILRARRLAAVNSLGAGVAHELNNPLTSVVGLITIAARNCVDDAQARILSLALEQTKRVIRIIDDLRSLTISEAEKGGKRFALLDSVKTAIGGFERQFGDADMRIETSYCPDLPEMQGDAAQIERMIAHLIENAINATPPGGMLQVGVQPVDRDAIRLWVKDSGKGISPEFHERIFDPFFTTKDQPSRLGLGLSICHAIVDAHHGKISMESEQGKGTTFTVVFPAAPPGNHIY